MDTNGYVSDLGGGNEVSALLETIRHVSSTEQVHQLDGLLNDQVTQSPGLSLTWKELSVSLWCRNDKFFGFIKRPYIKKIIENGEVKPGNLVALMGPSGAGKSTILSALARRCQGNTIISGDIRLNGREVDDSIRNITGYMYQEDFFISVITIREHLRYMAKLRMDRRMSNAAMEQRINALIAALGLDHVADSRIGGLAAEGEKGTLSGGEKKRVSFATICLTLPQLFFVDEPTTGLDSFTAARLVSMMKSIVNSTGASMIATIHQPNPEILALFSSIILVAEGRVVFSGAVDEAVQFLNDQGFKMSKKITDGEYLLECVAPSTYEERKITKKLPVRKIAAAYEASDYHGKLMDSIESLHYEGLKTTKSSSHKGQFWVVQLFWLTIRGILELIRNPEVQWIRIGQKLLIALTTGICYHGTLQADQKGVQAVQGVLFLMVTENVFAPMYAVMAVYPKEYPLFIREYRNGAYSPLAYYISKMFVIGPGAVVEAFLFTTLLYFLAGLRFSFIIFIITAAFTAVCINVAAACGAFFSNAFSTIPVAMMYLIPVEYVSMVTSGIFIRLSSLPTLTAWLQYVSWFKYTYESLSIVQWVGVTNITCEAEEALKSSCLRDGNDVLQHYDFSENHLISNMVSLIGLYVILQVLGYRCFLRKVKRDL